MRCKACNKQLNDNESVYKDNETGEYLDTVSYTHLTLPTKLEV